MDDVLVDAVNKVNASDSMLVVDTMSYTMLANRNLQETVMLLERFQAYNKDLFLVLINTNTRGRSSHWLLGLVIFDLEGN